MTVDRWTDACKTCGHMRLRHSFQQQCQYADGATGECPCREFVKDES